MGRLLLIVGNTLTVGAFFFRWLDLTSGLSGVPAEGYNPWLMLQSQGLSLVCPLSLLLLILGCVGCSLAIVITHSVVAASTLRTLAFAGLGFSFFYGLFTLLLLPDAIAFNYPYYESTPNIGAGLELVGFVFLLIGLMFFDWHQRPAQPQN